VRAGPGLGAVTGLGVGLALIGLVIFLPSARQGSLDEVGDALLVMGVPLVVVGTAVGAMVGAMVGRRTQPDSPSRATRRSTVAIVVGALVACVLAVWIFVSGTGLSSAFG
jgi:hypothetical protein